MDPGDDTDASTPVGIWKNDIIDCNHMCRVGATECRSKSLWTSLTISGVLSSIFFSLFLLYWILDLRIIVLKDLLAFLIVCFQVSSLIWIDKITTITSPNTHDTDIYTITMWQILRWKFIRIKLPIDKQIWSFHTSFSYLYHFTPLLPLYFSLLFSVTFPILSLFPFYFSLT